MKTNAARSHPWRWITAGLVCAALAAPPARAQTAEEFQALKAAVAQMQKTIAEQSARIAELEKAQQGQAAVLAASPSEKTIQDAASGVNIGHMTLVVHRPAMNDQQEAASRPLDYTLDPKYNGFIPVPNTPVLMKINAKPHVDMTYDNMNAGNQNRFVPAVFPLEGTPQHGGGGQFNMNANATQIRVDVRAPSLEGNLRFYYQNDFFGSGSDTGNMKYRVQHLYGEFYGFKAGFTYGAWEDPDSWPDTVDYEGPNAVIFSRRPVLHYTQVWNENWNTTYGIEEPDIYVDTNSGPHAGGYQTTRMPDFAINTRYEKAGFGHIQFSGTLRELGAVDAIGQKHHVTAWGLNASLGLDVSDDTTFQFLGVVGDGVGGMGNDTSFLNSDAAFDVNGKLVAMPYWSAHVAMTHKWDQTMRTTLTYGYVDLDNATGQVPTFYHTSTYASVNAVWQVRKKMSIGAELLYGIMHARNNVSSGDHYRMQLGLVYGLFD